MEVQQTGMFMTKEDEDQFNSWTKEEIYEAYLLEYNKANALGDVVKKLQRMLAEIRYAVGGEGGA